MHAERYGGPTGDAGYFSGSVVIRPSCWWQSGLARPRDRSLGVFLTTKAHMADWSPDHDALR